MRHAHRRRRPHHLPLFLLPCCLASDLWSDLLDSLRADRLDSILAQHASAYRGAQPFPHAVIDGLFPPSVLAAVAAEIPEERFARQVSGATAGSPRNPNQRLKQQLRDEYGMGPATRMVFAALKSSVFLRFLERLTGVAHLVPDPGFDGSGLHVTGDRGFLTVHADFNHLPAFDLDRRVNCFVYLNKDWLDSWGGHLELWDRNLTHCRQRIAPHFGRFVAFTTNDLSWHGHPAPMALPPGRSRRSLALYYYTNGRPVDECTAGPRRDAGWGGRSGGDGGGGGGGHGGGAAGGGDGGRNGRRLGAVDPRHEHNPRGTLGKCAGGGT